MSRFTAKDPADVNVEIGGDRPAPAVGPFERIDEIEVGDFLEGCGGLPLSGRIVGTGCCETGVANQQAGHFVVGDVIGRRGRKNNLGSSPADRLGDSTPGIVVVEDGEVAELQTYVSRPDQRRRGTGFLAADCRNCFRVVLGAAAIAGGHRGDRDRVAELAQQGKRTGALKLHIVGMSMQGQRTD